jgi:hypothetical protein
VGHWDFHGIELFAEETAVQVVATLPETHGFHENGVFVFAHVRWLYVGWSDANAVAYRALVAFCQQTGGMDHPVLIRTAPVGTSETSPETPPCGHLYTGRESMATVR